MTDARTEILSRIRSALAGVDAGAPLPEVDGEVGQAADVALFVDRARAAGASVHEVPAGGDAAAVVLEVLGALNAQRIAVSRDPDARAAVAGFGGEVVRGADEREPLFTCDAGVTGAQAAVAETGTLVLRTDAEDHRLVSLVPEVHVAVLRRSAVVATLDDLFRSLEDEGAAAADLPRCVTLVTGPSRTADIELQLVVGVHGPRALHVVLID